MSKKQFLAIKLLTMIVLTIVVSTSVVNGFWVLPIISLLATLAFLLIIKKNVKEVLTDERDYKITGDASRYTIYVYSFIGAIIVIFLASLDNLDYQNWINAIAYSICFLMILNVLIFKILNKRK